MSDDISDGTALAAQLWCDERTSGVEMDTRIATVAAERFDELLGRIEALERERDAAVEEIRQLRGTVEEQGERIGALIDITNALRAALAEIIRRKQLFSAAHSLPEALTYLVGAIQDAQALLREEDRT